MKLKEAIFRQCYHPIDDGVQPTQLSTFVSLFFIILDQNLKRKLKKKTIRLCLRN